MQRALLLLLTLLASCEKAKPKGELVDEGVFISTSDGAEIAREEFSIRKVNDTLVTTAQSTTGGGELVTDLAWHPIRMDYKYTGKPIGFRLTLHGSPLVLDRVRDDNDKPERATADMRKIDYFVEAPGMIALTPLCSVTEPKIYSTLSTSTSGYNGRISVKAVDKAGALKKVTIAYIIDYEIELYCDGTKIVASGLRSNKLWNVREGREADFKAAAGL